MIIVVQNLQKIPGMASLLMEQYKPDILLAQEINWTTEEHDVHKKHYCVAHHTSKHGGYGTAILCQKQYPLTNVKKILSPHAEFGGFIVKKTILASTTSLSPIQLISFHGYNGQPFKDVTKLIDHVRAVLTALDQEEEEEEEEEDDEDSNENPAVQQQVSVPNNNNNKKEHRLRLRRLPAIFAGDFNTWTPLHVRAVQQEMNKFDFQLVYSWPYPGRQTPLDHVFIRNGTGGPSSKTGGRLFLKSARHFGGSSSSDGGSDHYGAIIEVESTTTTTT